jgi:cyclomaltodextrinase / maltogenic alpha-amylase / neopullulanase
VPVSVDTPAWVRDAVFYQIFPDRFAASDRVVKPGSLEPWDTPPTTHGFKGGDLLGIVEHLDYLEDLGVNAIYLTPIFQSASNHRYHTYDYFHVDPLLGGDAALRELLDRAHARGMRVVLDGVFNHTGRGFWPFHHILESGGASPYRDWFHLDQDVLAGQRTLTPYPPGDEPTGASLGYQAWWGLPALPKLNTDHPPVREFLFSVAEHWLRFGIDGWRLDVPTEIRDETFWQEFRRRCRAVRPDAYLVGEIWDLAPEWLRGDRFDALMDYPMAEAILGFVGGPSLDLAVIAGHHEYSYTIRPMDASEFAARLEELLHAYDPDVVAVQLNLIGSHDAPRARTVLGEDLAALRMAILLQAALPGAPCVYYGDEVGLSGGNDPACRAAFPWSGIGRDDALHAFVRSLFRVRHDSPALRHGATRVLAAAGPALAIERRVGDDAVVVAVNAGSDAVDLDVMIDGASSGHLVSVRLDGVEAMSESVIGGARARLSVPPRIGGVWRIVPD